MGLEWILCPVWMEIEAEETGIACVHLNVLYTPFLALQIWNLQTLGEGPALPTPMEECGCACK